MNTLSLRALARLLPLVLVLTACGAQGTTDASDQPSRLQIVTTIAQVADVAQNVGGEHVQVTPLMGPGIDPHLYTASEGDVDLLRNADIIFYNGYFLEANMASVLQQIGQSRTVVAVAEQVDESRLLPWEDYPDQHDPHVWFDIALWMQVTETIRDTLIAQDAEHAEAYTANAAAYLAELEELHAYVLAQAERIPAQQRVLITAHDAFQYFGAAYGFDVMGLEGISTASEAGAADVRALADLIVEREIPAIFVESSVSVRNIEAVQAAVNARGFDVTIGGELHSDAMGDPGTPAGTYIGMVRHNIDTIVSALLQDAD